MSDQDFSTLYLRFRCEDDGTHSVLMRTESNEVKDDTYVPLSMMSVEVLKILQERVVEPHKHSRLVNEVNRLLNIKTGKIVIDDSPPTIAMS